MKLFNINKVLGVCVIGLLLTACRDGNDWSTDGSHKRLFGVADDISVTAEDTEAEITFKTVPNADHYTIELSTDSLYDDIAEGATAGSKVFNTTFENISSASVIMTVKGLNGETKYYLRVKAVSDGTIPSSKWVYYKTGSGRGYFITKAEQIFYPLEASDIEDGVLHVNWQAEAQVTHLKVLANGEEVNTITLNASDIAAGKYDIIGLAPTTTYTIEIYNGEVRRGSLNVTTPASMPAADYKYTLDAAVTILTQNMLNEIAEEAMAASSDPTNYSVTIGIPSDVTIDIHGTSEDGSATSVKIPEGMSVTFFGLAGGEKPVINASKSLDIRGSHAFVRFENVVITDGGCQYLINQSEGCTLGEFAFTDVDIKNMSRSWIRLQGSSAKAIERLIIDGCTVDTQGAGGYALFYFNNAAYTIGSMIVKNSTFSNLVHSFTDCRNANIGGITVSDCTFYNIIGPGRYFVDAQGVNVSINVTNTIFALTNTDTSKGIRDATMETVNSYMTNDFVLSSNKFTVDQEYDGSSTDLFADPANGDFTIKVATIKSGDPRWIKQE